jgi:hypothetical protein
VLVVVVIVLPLHPMEEELLPPLGDLLANLRPVHVGDAEVNMRWRCQRAGDQQGLPRDEGPAVPRWPAAFPIEGRFHVTIEDAAAYQLRNVMLDQFH